MSGVYHWKQHPACRSRLQPPQAAPVAYFCAGFLALPVAHRRVERRIRAPPSIAPADVRLPCASLQLKIKPNHSVEGFSGATTYCSVTAGISVHDHRQERRPPRPSATARLRFCFRLLRGNRPPPGEERTLGQLFPLAECPNRQPARRVTRQHATPIYFPLSVPLVMGSRSPPGVEKDPA